MEWKEVITIVLAIAAWLMKNKIESLDDRLQAAEDAHQKFKSQYYVKMELREKDSNEKFAKVYAEITSGTAHIMDKMNEDKLQVLQKINELSLQIKNG